MAPMRAWIKRSLPPTTVATLRSMRHASSQALAGADMYHLRVDLERRIEERLRETDAAQDQRILAAVREELTAELDRWGQDMMDRMDILLSATNRLLALLEGRVTELERRIAASSDHDAGGPAPASPEPAPPERVAG